MTRVGMDEEVPLEHPWVTKSIEKAQTRVEQMHFEIRKNLLKFDDVMDSQRDTIYTLRDTILSGDDLKATIWGMIERVVANSIDENLPEKGGPTLETPDRFEQWLTTTFPVQVTWKTPLAQTDLDDIQVQALDALRAVYEAREVEMGPETMRLLERLLLLDRIDNHWKDHLYNIDYIEEGIRFGAGYGGKDPIVVFKNEALGVFESMYQHIEEEVSEFIFKSRVNTEAPRRAPARRSGRSGGRPRRPMRKQNAAADPGAAEFASQQAMGTTPKIGRNAPCPCGSGKKYKRCCGR